MAVDPKSRETRIGEVLEQGVAVGIDSIRFKRGVSLCVCCIMDYRAVMCAKSVGLFSGWESTVHPSHCCAWGVHFCYKLHAISYHCAGTEWAETALVWFSIIPAQHHCESEGKVWLYSS